MELPARVLTHSVGHACVTGTGGLPAPPHLALKLPVSRPDLTRWVGGLDGGLGQRVAGFFRMVGADGRWLERGDRQLVSAYGRTCSSTCSSALYRVQVGEGRVSTAPSCSWAGSVPGMCNSDHFMAHLPHLLYMGTKCDTLPQLNSKDYPEM